MSPADDLAARDLAQPRNGRATHSDAILARLLELHPKIIDLTLDRMWRLLAIMGHPERRLPPVVHIAGTNGKGSTLAMMRAGLEAGGAKVHAYTSPHLVRFHERVRLAGELIPEADLAALLEECETANGREPITFFEITTVAALTAFARIPADWTLLEVGLGGRLDATNVVDAPALTVITPVSLDHQQYLGETIADIAFEKAGILKPGVPCVVAEQHPKAREVILRRAEEVGAQVLLSGRDWRVRPDGTGLVFEDDAGSLELPAPVLPGAHQIENAGTAVAALRVLDMDDTAARCALTQAEWPARLQRLRQGPLVDALPPKSELWLDGGHNEAAGRVLARHLRKDPGRPTFLILGMLETKDATAYLTPLAPLVLAAACLRIPDAAASFDAATLAELAQMVGIASYPVDDAMAGLLSLRPYLVPGARVVICGSLYLAGSILAENG